MKILKKIVPIIVVVSVILAVFLYIDSNQEPAKISLNDLTDVEYNNIADRQKLDVFYPEKIKETKNPVVVYLHGGSYSFGRRTEFRNEFKEIFTKNGYIYVPVGYRLRDDKPYPAAVDDVKTAIRFLKENKDKYKIDEDRVYVMGHSVGANLASMVASTAGIESLSDEVIKYDNVDSKIAGLIGISGFYDLNTFFATLKEQGLSKAKTLHNIVNYYNLENYDPSKPLVKENNINYIKNLNIPVFFQHGLHDGVVKYTETLNYCSAIAYRVNNSNVHCEIIANNTHKLEPFLSEINMTKIIKWLDEQSGLEVEKGTATQ